MTNSWKRRLPPMLTTDSRITIESGLSGQPNFSSCYPTSSKRSPDRRGKGPTPNFISPPAAHRCAVFRPVDYPRVFRHITRQLGPSPLERITTQYRFQFRHCFQTVSFNVSSGAYLSCWQRNGHSGISKLTKSLVQPLAATANPESTVANIIPNLTLTQTFEAGCISIGVDHTAAPSARFRIKY